MLYYYNHYRTQQQINIFTSCFFTKVDEISADCQKIELDKRCLTMKKENCSVR